MTKTFPWEYHKDLTEERLVAVGQMVLEARRLAVELFDSDIGDDGWTLGCRASQFARYRILTAFDGQRFPWLTVIDRSRRLIFTIGEVPVRIYRGEAEEPTARTLHQSLSELDQLGFSFDERDEGHDLAYRFAVETDVDGSALAVKFVGLRGETAVLNWNVPLGLDAFTGGIGMPATESVELDAPSVGVRDRKTKTGE